MIKIQSIWIIVAALGQARAAAKKMSVAFEYFAARRREPGVPQCEGYKVSRSTGKCHSETAA
jgi:hypothetical protein